jgi:hypothetical protein
MTIGESTPAQAPPVPHTRGENSYYVSIDRTAFFLNPRLHTRPDAGPAQQFRRAGRMF